MINLGQATRSLIDRLRVKDAAVKKTDYTLPVQPVFKERNFLICRGSGGASAVSVDDMGSCLVQGVHDHTSDGIVRKDWHSYRYYEGEREYACSVRCPASLSQEERLRLEQDVPPGRRDSRLASVRAERGRQAQTRGKSDYEI